MDNDLLLHFMDWYKSNCNGQWERDHGVEIKICADMSWSIVISIQDTSLEHKQFSNIIKKKDGNNWINCFVDFGFFHGNCGILSLQECLRKFLTWAQDTDEKEMEHNIHLDWLALWTLRNFLSFRKPESGVRIFTIDNPGWGVNIDLSRFIDKPLNFNNIDRNEEDWVICAKKNDIFTGAGGPLNLIEILASFHSWIESNEVPLTQQPLKKWTLLKRYDARTKINQRHYNKVLKKYFETPHVHDPNCPGEVREPREWEIPKGTKECE